MLALPFSGPEGPAEIGFYRDYLLLFPRFLCGYSWNMVPKETSLLSGGQVIIVAACCRSRIAEPCHYEPCW